MAWTPRQRAGAELGFALVSITARIPVKNTPLAMPTLLLLTAIWAVIFFFKASRSPRFVEWGIKADWSPAAWLSYATLAVAGVSAVALVVLALGWRFTATPVPAALAVYLLWSFAQQFALQNLFVADLAEIGLRERLLPVVGAVTFGFAHWPDWRLGILAGIGAVAWVFVWRRNRNLWLAGISHMLVGTAAVVWLFHRDPAGEFIEFLQRFN